VNYSFNAIQSEKLGVSYPIHPIFFDLINLLLTIINYNKGENNNHSINSAQFKFQFTFKTIRTAPFNQQARKM